MARGTAFATRSMLSFMSGVMKMLSSMNTSPFPLSLNGTSMARGRAALKGMSGGIRFGTMI